MATNDSRALIEKVDVQVLRIPTENPESDGTLQWDATIMIVVHVHAAAAQGLGYSYGEAAMAPLIRDKLAGAIRGLDALDVGRSWETMVHTVRNAGQTGMAMMAAAAVDIALWDLKAKLLGMPLVKVLGQMRQAMPLYGSGGFTSYSNEQLCEQLAWWAAQGMQWVKMKIGRDPHADPARVRQARSVLDKKTSLFVDANGAYDRKQALLMAEHIADYGVTWFEEPVYHRDLEGLRLLRDRAPACMEIAAGEYGFDLFYFRDLLEHGAIDVVQIDATRAGITGFMQVSALCESRNLPISSHTAPAANLHPACAAPRARHMEYFHDHVRIEEMVFEGAVKARQGTLAPALNRPGLGLEFKRVDARKFEL